MERKKKRKLSLQNSSQDFKAASTSQDTAQEERGFRDPVQSPKWCRIPPTAGAVHTPENAGQRAPRARPGEESVPAQQEEVKELMS